MILEGNTHPCKCSGERNVRMGKKRRNNQKRQLERLREELKAAQVAKKKISLDR